MPVATRQEIEPVAREFAASHFQEHGHVAIANLHASELASATVPEIGIFRRLRTTVGYPGEQAQTITNLAPSALVAPNYLRLRDSVYVGADIIGHSLEGRGAVDKLIISDAWAEGPVHKDHCHLTDVTALTTIEGSSFLDIIQPDNNAVRYNILPGVVLYLDGKRLRHRGGALEVGRVSLVFSKFVSPPKITGVM